MSNSSVGGVPTSGIGVAATVRLTGSGVTTTVPSVAGTRGVSQYAVNVPIGGSVAITALPYDVQGNLVPATTAAVAAVSSGTNLGTSLPNYAVLGKSAVTGSTGAGSVIRGGNVGLDAAYSSITNFPPSNVVAPNDVEANTGGGVIVANATAVHQAYLDLLAAITYWSITYPATLGGAITIANAGNMSASTAGGGGAGVYHAGAYTTASSLDIPTSITLDAQGDPNAIFVFFSPASTTTLESGASIILANGAQAGNVYWVVGSSFTSVWNSVKSDMVGNILAVSSITLGGGTLNGRAAAGAAVTMSTTETITMPTAVAAVAAVYSVTNVVVNASNPLAGKPAWYRPSNSAPYNNTSMAPCTVDDTDGNPWTVRGVAAGQVNVNFQIPTFENTEGSINSDDTVNKVMDETPIDQIFASLLVTVTGGTS